MRTAIILLLICFCMPALADSATLKVPSQFLTIQDAIDAAVYDDVVLVATGTYEENIDFKGKAITVTSEKGADVTVIDGNETESVVTCMSGEGADSVLDGFTITNGWASKGGGMYNFLSTPTVTNCTFSGNCGDSYGGGIYCNNISDPNITNNTITGNTAGGGGGIFCEYSSPTIKNNTIAVNTATTGMGGGIGYWSSSPTITNNTITGNTAGGGGGIACAESSTSTIKNNLITGNIADNKGGGISCDFYSCCPTITNNTIIGNTAISYGGGISCGIASSPIITNTIFWNNSAPTGTEFFIGSSLTISYSDVEGGQSLVHIDPGCTLIWGPGNIDSDPLFVDPANGDFHLTFNSPCRASGDNLLVLDLHDYEGDPRIAYGTVDMGADEFFTHLYWTGDATPGGNVEIKLIGLPGTSPVFLWVGSGVLGAPIPTMYGEWHLDFPILLSLGLGPIFTPEGVSVLPYTFDPGFPAMDIPMQVLIGVELSNLSVLEIK